MFGLRKRAAGAGSRVAPDAGVDPDAEVIADIDAFAASLRREETPEEAAPGGAEGVEPTPQ